jgi:CHAD domain-containing protein
VAARRLRSLAAAIPEPPDRRARDRCVRDARALANEMAAVRDADVLREQLLAALERTDPAARDARRALLGMLEKERAAARGSLHRHTQSLAWSERLERLSQSVHELREQAARASDAQGLARAVLLESARALAQARRRVDGRAASLHHLRVQAKAYRYVNELLAPELKLDGDGLAAPARAAQQALGRYLDARNARKWIAGHRKLLAKSPGPALEELMTREEKRALKKARRVLRKLDT